MKNLEFNILNNEYLEVADYVWWLKRIDAIYITRSEMEKHKFTICVQQGKEIIELYYRTDDEVKISNAFIRLSDAVKEAQSGFDITGFSALINYNNVKNIELSNGILNSKIVIKFENSKLVKKGGKSLYNQMKRNLKNIQIDNRLVK